MEYLNLYKIYFKDTGRITDFLDYETLKIIIEHLKKTNRHHNVEIFSIDMPNVTNQLAIMQ